jgi:hypothetical protein
MNPHFFFMRRRRDSNPREAINPYLVSSEALSTTQPRLLGASHYKGG